MASTSEIKQESGAFEGLEDIQEPGGSVAPPSSEALRLSEDILPVADVDCANHGSDNHNIKVENEPFVVVPIEDSFPKIEKYLSVTERYYTPRFYMDANFPGEDHCVLFHSNKICVVTLAPRHPVLAERKTISKVNFQVSTNLDRSKNKVSGKGKNGAQFLQPTSILCYVQCQDGTRYAVRSCVQGKLVEVNETLVDNPSLLLDKPTAEGYVAIVLPSLAKSSQQKSELLTLEEYNTPKGEKQQ